MVKYGKSPTQFIERTESISVKSWRYSRTFPQSPPSSSSAVLTENHRRHPEPAGPTDWRFLLRDRLRYVTISKTVLEIARSLKILSNPNHQFVSYFSQFSYHFRQGWKNQIVCKDILWTNWNFIRNFKYYNQPLAFKNLSGIRNSILAIISLR